VEPIVFESAELSHRIDKATFVRELPLLREALLEAQVELARSAKFHVVILIAGMDGAGRGEIVNLLNEWMDPRHIQTHGMGDPAAEENERPANWRFWRVLPPKGKIGLFLGSWYTWPLLERAYGKIKSAQLAERMQENARFEKMLVDEDTLVLKFWMHLSKTQQRNRLESLQKDRRTRWRVTERDWTHYKLYDKLHTAAETALTLTSTAEAPWLIVSGDDRYYRNLTIGQFVLEALRKRLAAQKAAPSRAPAPTALPPLSLPTIDNIHILKSLDLGQTVGKKNFRATLEKYQGKLNLLTRNPRFRNTPVVVVFEGNDAAGKGGAIRRITAALDARMYQVVPIAAPTDEERARPYLWRFWRHIPRRGRITVFDRSWYGRVLVERVEGFCRPYDWMRAYSEIVDFESQLTRHGFVVVKFWLSISKDEQLRRFRERKTTGFKRFKITEEDWRNRKKWDEYERAVCDMVDRTSTEIAPWTLVEANDKAFARIKILKTLCRRIEARLQR
jgi:polyphosphate:AMP phosphotransferase